MPREVLKLNHGIEWRQTILRRRDFGVETDFRFATPDGLLIVVVNTLPCDKFNQAILDIVNLAIIDRSLSERWWLESYRYEFQLNENDQHFGAAIYCDQLWWAYYDEVETE